MAHTWLWPIPDYDPYTQWCIVIGPCPLPSLAFIVDKIWGKKYFKLGGISEFFFKYWIQVFGDGKDEVITDVRRIAFVKHVFHFSISYKNKYFNKVNIVQFRTNMFKWKHK